MANEVEKRQLFLTFPEEQINQPILYKVSTEFGVIPNILGATINEKQGKVAIELVGDSAKIDEVMTYFADLGVQVEKLEADDIERRLRPSD